MAKAELCEDCGKDSHVCALEGYEACHHESLARLRSEVAILKAQVSAAGDRARAWGLERHEFTLRQGALRQQAAKLETEVAALKAQLEAAGKVVEAAKWMRTHHGPHVAFDAALVELENLK
jgi:hypothetical protein